MGYLRRGLCDHPAVHEFERVASGLSEPHAAIVPILLRNGNPALRAERCEPGEAKPTFTVQAPIPAEEELWVLTTASGEHIDFVTRSAAEQAAVRIAGGGGVTSSHRDATVESVTTRPAAPPMYPRRRYALPAVAALTYLAATAWTSGAQMVAVELFVWVLLFLALWLRFPERLRSTPVTPAALAPAPKPHSLYEWFSPTATCPECNVDCEHRTEVHDLDPERDDANTIGRRCRCGHRWAQRASL